MFNLKYRPQKFSEMSKPNESAEALMKQVVAGKTSQSYLFIGSRGVGKTTAARLLAKALNCSDLAKNGDPCGKCSSCEAIVNGKFLDLTEIDAASNRGIDDIRSLKESVSLSSFSSKYKIYIIDEVHMLTLEAFNALLKTLEEPPKHVVFILCTTEGHKVPETIKSRCQVFRFQKPSVGQIVERLEWIAEKEKAKITKKDLQKIALASFGGFRDADVLLQQVIEGEMDVDALIGSGSFDSFISLTGDIIDGKTQSAVSLISRIAKDGTSILNWANEYIRYLRSLLFIQAGLESDEELPKELYAKMEEQAFKMTPTQIVWLIDRFLKALDEIKISPIQELPLEIAVVLAVEEIFSPGEESSEAPSFKSTSNEIEVSNEDRDVSSVSLSSVKERWAEILKEVKPFNHSVEALLRSCHPAGLKDGDLILEVSYAFHKDRLESSKNREIVEKVLRSLFGVKLKVKCVLQSKAGESLTDKNIVEPVDSKAAKKAIDVFDGGIEL